MASRCLAYFWNCWGTFLMANLYGDRDWDFQHDDRKHCSRTKPCFDPPIDQARQFFVKIDYCEIYFNIQVIYGFACQARASCFYLSGIPLSEWVCRKKIW